MRRQQFNPTEGDVVLYKDVEYWVYEDRGLKVILVPMDAVDFQEGITHLNQAFEVLKEKLKPYDAG